MNLNLIVYIGLILFLCGCGNSERETSYSLSELPTFLPESKEGSYDKSGLITIPYDVGKSRDLEVEEWLEMERAVLLSDEYLLGGIRKVLIWKDQFIIQDKSRETLVSYDFEGNLQWVFDRKGEGPEEYIQIRDFDVNYEHDRIDLFDARGRKIMHISPVTGELLGTVPNSSFGNDIISLGDENVFFISQDLNPYYNQHLLVMNHENEVKYSFLPYHAYDYFHDWGSRNGLSKYNSTIYINYFANDTIYSLNNGHLKARFKFENTSKAPLDFHTFNNSLDFNNAIDQDRSLFSLIGDFNPINEQFFFFYTADPYIQWNIFDATTLETRTFSRFDKDVLFPFRVKNKLPIEFISVSQGRLIRQIEPADYKVYRRAIENKQTTEDGEQASIAIERDYPLAYRAITETQDDSNVILVLYKLKK